MGRFALFLLALTAIVLSAGCVVTVGEPVPVPQPGPPPLPPIGPTVAYFYDSLAPWGEWIWSDAWGWVWTPRRVSTSWSPYREGQWIWTADGWYWLSDEPWGWATYHYGRWAWVHRWGWVWVPGDVWAPAWVAWRWGGGWAGWAPLPPEARWVDDRLYWDGDIDVWIDVDWWCFVQEIHVVEPRVYRYAVPVGRNVALVRTAKDRTRYVKDRDRVVGRGFEVDEVRRAVRKDVPVWRITDVSSPRDAGKAIEARREVQVWRPRLDPPAKDARPESAATGRIPREDTGREARRRAVPAAPPEAPEVEAPSPVPVPPVKREPVARPRAAEPDLAAERERLVREQAAERERLERQQAEEARRVREEQERKVRTERDAADARARAELAETQRLERERAADVRRASDEAERRAIEARAAEERRAREAALAKEQVEQQRVDEERRVRAEAERKALGERQAEERRVQRERADEERRALEERARRQAERAERERPAKKEKAEEKKEPEKTEPEKKEEPPPPERRRGER